MHGPPNIRYENVSGLRQVEAGLSHLKSRFDPTSLHMGFKVDKVSFKLISLRVLRFSPAIVIPQVRNAIIQWYIVLNRRTNGRSLGTFQKKQCCFGNWRELPRKINSLFHYFALWPTNTQLFHKLSHYYMFRHCRVILRDLVINTLPSYTIISNAAVGNTVYS